jgi:outer membrane receptor protein involved in Fe transport
MKGGLQLRKDNCFDIMFSAVYVSQQFWQDTNVGVTQIPKAKIPAFKVFNLSGDLYITKNLRLIAGISNLTDENSTIACSPMALNPRRVAPVTLVCPWHFDRWRCW